MIEQIHILCQEGKVKWTKHGLERLQERGLTRLDVVCAVKTGEIIKNYPDDTPNPSCLILGLDQKNEKIHVVMGMNQDYLWFITAYRPDPKQWSDDLKMRRS